MLGSLLLLLLLLLLLRLAAAACRRGFLDRMLQLTLEEGQLLQHRGDRCEPSVELVLVRLLHPEAGESIKLGLEGITKGSRGYVDNFLGWLRR